MLLSLKEGLLTSQSVCMCECAYKLNVYRLFKKKTGSVPKDRRKPTSNSRGLSSYKQYDLITVQYIQELKIKTTPKLNS